MLTIQTSKYLKPVCTYPNHPTKIEKSNQISIFPHSNTNANMLELLNLYTRLWETSSHPPHPRLTIPDIINTILLYTHSHQLCTFMFLNKINRYAKIKYNIYNTTTVDELIALYTIFPNMILTGLSIICDTRCSNLPKVWLNKLTHLEITNPLHQVRAFDANIFKKCPNLTSFTIHKSTIHNIEYITLCSKLHTLHLIEFTLYNDMSILPKLPNLRTITLFEREIRQNDIKYLAQCPNL